MTSVVARAHRADIVVVTGLSGAGKSTAIKVFEDLGYYCVDNLPPELLLPFVALEQESSTERVAIAVDVRSATSLPLVPAQLRELRRENVTVRSLFLDATTDTLVRRFSETRRRHPLSAHGGSARDGEDGRRALVEAIELERELLGDLRRSFGIRDEDLLRESYSDLLRSASSARSASRR